MNRQTHFESLAEALNQAIEYEKGNKSMGRLRITAVPNIEPVAEYSKEQIKEIRQRTNLPQKYFAELVGVSLRAVEAWETGKRKPTGSAKRLFQLIEKDPNVVISMIR
ncbi:MAG: helix-turn-helix domain-containing protein [Oscillospiraceae bacterium]|nr:helix-turn-helix domain-containing protein [Oscillospiraceae bacterium]